MRGSIWAVAAMTVLAGCGPELTQEVAEPGDVELDSASNELTSSRAALWFPIATGNNWTLTAVASTTLPATRTLSLSSVQGALAHLNGLTPAGQWVGIGLPSSNTLLGRPVASAPWAPFIRFGYAVTPWNWGSGACGSFTARRVATDISVSTPAGLFTGVRTIRFDFKPSPTARCVAPAFKELSFAPGVGLIALTDGQDQRYELTSAKVGTTVYPLPVKAALVGTLTSDAALYTNQPNHIFCITTPCPGNEVTATGTFTFSVKNQAPTAFGVNTYGCILNVQLLDSAGTVVTSANDTRFCEPNSHSTVFAPGETKTFVSKILLKETATGQQLNGDYTARAFLTDRDPAGKVAPATVAFKVNLAP